MVPQEPGVRFGIELNAKFDDELPIAFFGTYRHDQINEGRRSALDLFADFGIGRIIGQWTVLNTRGRFSRHFAE